MLTYQMFAQNFVSTEDDYIPYDYTCEIYEGYDGVKKMISGSGNHGTVFSENKDEIIEWILDFFS